MVFLKIQKKSKIIHIINQFLRYYSKLINEFAFPFGVLINKLPIDFDDFFFEIN